MARVIMPWGGSLKPCIPFVMILTKVCLDWYSWWNLIKIVSDIELSCYITPPWKWPLFPGWPDVSVKKSPKDNAKSPKKSPNHVFVRFTISNCFMMFSVSFYANIQWHWTFFYSFFVHKRGDKFFWIFLKKHVKNLFSNKILAFLRSILGD